jgi:hypothetical protein
MPDHQELLRPSQDRRPALLSIRTEGSISSRRERIELGIELTPSGSAGAVVRACCGASPKQSKLLTLYLANANLLWLLNIVTVVAIGILFVTFGRYRE